jgi:phospholipase C
MIPRSLRVFLCHSSGDKDAVRALSKRLRAEGAEPWLDEEQILPGQDWESEIYKAVRDTDIVLVCLSQHSINKRGFVQKEIRAVLNVADEQPQDAIFLVPCKLEDCDVPDRLRRYHWVELFSDDGFEKLKQTLAHCVARIEGSNRPLVPTDSAYSDRDERAISRTKDIRRETVALPRRIRLTPEAPGIQKLKHIVVLMMRSRSFDHMLGYMMARDPRIDGVDGTQTNPDTTGALVPVQPRAQYQSQLQPEPGQRYPDVDLQLFGDPRAAVPNMEGFVKAYYHRQNNVRHSHNVMYCFPPEKVPVISTLASNFLVFNRWFSSLPGPAIPNRAFAHFGTSFGRTDMDFFYPGQKYKTIHERMVAEGHTAKIYYYDPPSATMGGMNLLLEEKPALFGQFDQFRADCYAGHLPDYSFIEPNYTDHTVGADTVPAADQHPDHNVLAGEEFIASVYMSVLDNEDLWNTSLLLVVYDTHGGIYDHVPPPACAPDEFTDPQTRFKFDRLGIRVPAVLISPWIPKGRVVPDPALDSASRVFDHASIPATVAEHFGLDTTHRSPREAAASTFLDFLTLDKPRDDYIGFLPRIFGGGRR